MATTTAVSAIGSGRPRASKEASRAWASFIRKPSVSRLKEKNGSTVSVSVCASAVD